MYLQKRLDPQSQGDHQEVVRAQFFRFLASSGRMKLRPRYLLWLVSSLYALAIIMYLKHVQFQGDTDWLIDQTRAALDCAAQGHWIGCRDGGRFPLLQRIPVIPMIGLGFKNSRVMHCLALLNVLLVALTVALARRSLERRSRLGAWGFAAILLFGPFLVYAHSSFSEAMAASASLILVIACLEGWRGASVFALAFLAGLSRETAFPFLIVAGCLAFAIREPMRPLWRADGFAQLGFGITASLILSIGFNFFRYDGWTNQEYLDPIYQVHDLTTQANFFLALLFSPNGGLLFFWPIAVGLLVYPLVRARSSAWVIPGCWALLFGLILVFSRLSQPFGWWCWGPRYLVPWIPVLAFLALAAEPRLFDDIFARLARTPRALGMGGAILILISFQNAEEAYSGALEAWFSQADSVCPAHPEYGSAAYFGCMRYWAWSPHKSVLLKAFDPRLDPRAFAFACIAGIGMAHFLFRFGAKAKAGA